MSVYVGSTAVGQGLETVMAQIAADTLYVPLGQVRMPLDVAPPRAARFGSPLVLSRVHWVRPELVVDR